MRERPRWAGMLACFFLSGFASLLYQIAWTRQLGAVFGASEPAVAAVLAAYMGGLALGAAAMARGVRCVRRPFLVYGVLELGIAAAALAVPLAMGAAARLEGALLGGRSLPGAAHTLFYLGGSFAILGVPTSLMGATLPLLARAAVRSDGELGRRVGALYAVNTAGAIAGALGTGFLLLPAFGLRDTVWIGASLNAGAFALAVALGRGAADEAPPPEDAAAAAPFAWVLPLMLVSGAVSFGYEVLWTRLLAQVLGGSVYAFSTMLASVLLGIAVGGALAAGWARNPARAARGLAAAELAAAVLALAAFRALDEMPALAQRVGAGGSAGLAANAAIAVAILLAPSLAIGASFPFAVRVLAQGAADAGRASARVYAWNTLGAIAGSLATGFALLPGLGFAGTLRTGVALNLALGGAAAWLAPRRSPACVAAAALAGIALAILPVREPWQLLRASPLTLKPLSGELSYFGVGRSATVLMLRDEGRLLLRSNGLPESTIGLRGSRPHPEPLAAWLGALPAIARGPLRSQLVIGLGGGVALESVPASVERIDVIELEPRILAADRAAAAVRRADPLADPRVSVRIDDARSALSLSDRRYDAIVSQPSHPWSSGASHLYTREFFERVRARLAPDGVFVQWIGLAFVDEDLMRSLLATLLAVFPHVEVYRPAAWGVLFLASAAPFAAADALPAPSARELAELGVGMREDVAAALALDESGARALAAGGTVSSDDRNRLAMRSPRVLARPLGARGADALFAASDPLIPPPADLDTAYLVRRLASMGQPERADRVAQAVGDPAARATARGALALQRGERDAALRFAEAALAIDPTLETARELALLAARAAPPGDTDAGPPTSGIGALRAGWRAEAAGDWPALRELEPALAAVPARSMLEPEAVRLRATWRRAIGGPAGAREGLALLDPLLARFTTLGGLTLRAELADAAGDLGGALATWMELAGRGTPAERDAVARRVLARLRDADPAALPADERALWLAEWKAKLAHN